MFYCHLQEFSFLKSFLRARYLLKIVKHVFKDITVMNGIIQDLDRGMQVVHSTSVVGAGKYLFFVVS